MENSQTPATVRLSEQVEAATKSKEATFPGTSVLVARTSEAHVDETLKEQGIVVGSKATLAKKVEALTRYFEANVPAADQAECDLCRGMSDPDLPACPYCGDGEELPGEASQEAAPPPAPKGTKKAKQPTQEAKTMETTSAMVPAMAGMNGNGKKAHAADLVTARTAGDAKLDTRVLKIRELARGSRVKTYELGQALKDVYDNDLWKLRSTEKGKVAYKTWEQFIKEEVSAYGVSFRYSFMLMKVVDAFSAEQVAEVGPTKLRFVLEAPKEVQAELLEKAKGGMSKRQLDQEASKHKPAKPSAEGERRSPGQVKAKSKDTSRAHKPKETKVITVAAIQGKKTIKLYAKPARRGEELRPAKNMGDCPWGHLDLVNDVRMFVTFIKTPTGEFRAQVDIRRVED